MFPKRFVERGEPMLKVEAFNKERQFYDITFELHKGEILGFYGLIGAGRSELARAIFGLESLDSGKIFVNDDQVHIRNPRIAMKHGMAYLPEDRQHQGVILPMNITNNITLPILDQFVKMGLVDTGKEARVAKKNADMLDVRASGLWKKVMQLSGGNQQKVVLAKWLATNPQVLILDEPTRGIDVGAKASVHRFMSELVSQGIGIMMISSELPEILGMSDRIIVMHEGRITGEFTREEASQDKILSAAAGISSNQKN
jgi:rhamnose transport system ATP-binding protein